MGFSYLGIRNLGLSCAVALSLPFAFIGCGGGDDGGEKAAAGSGSGGSEATGGSNTTGGTASDAGSGTITEGGSGEETGGSSSTAGSSSSAGKGGTGSNGGAGGGSSWSGNFDDCNPPKEGVEHCQADNPDHAGTGVCTEFYTAGQAKLICSDQAADGPCPRDKLYGICVGGISTYSYAENPQDGATFYSQSPRLCEVQGAKWCGPR